VTKYLPSYAGLLMEREVLGLDRVLKTPKSPFVAIVGGAKMETKIPVMRSILKIADSLLIGGGIINTYLKSLGFGVGGSIVDDGALDLARQICRNKKVIKPLDLVVGTMDGSSWRIVEIGSSLHSLCESGEAIFDIGPMTIELYDSIIAKARTIVWNGAMGYFEVSPYHIGTLSIADMIADRSDRAHTVIGGGETLLSMDMIGRTGEIGLVSTGGGAMLEYLSGEVLPGVEVLDRII
jgi:phosphoglycerate kinase